MARWREKDAGSPSLLDRLLAAFLAPIFFNLAAFIMVALIGQRLPLPASWFWYEGLWHLPPLVPLFTVVAAVVGFFWGTRGFADFLGHAFYTHTEQRRSPLTTGTIWTAIGLLAWDLSANF